MNIEKIKLENFGKYQSFETDFEDLIVIKGPNGSGKSTIVEGINYCFTGGIRRIYKKSEELIKMSNNDNDMKVSIKTNNIELSRSLSREKRSISEKLYVEGLEDKNATSKQKFLDDMFKLDSNLLNPINFLNLNQSDKSKYILNFISDVSFSKKDLYKKLSYRINKNTLDYYMSTYDDGKSSMENIDLLLKTVSNDKRSAAKELKETFNNRCKLAEIESEISSVNQVDENQIKELQKDINSMKIKVSLIENNKKRRSDLKKKIAEAEIYINENKIDEINKKIETLSNDIEKSSSSNYLQDLSDKVKLEMDKLENLKDKAIKQKYSHNKLVDEFKELDELENKIKQIEISKQCVVNPQIKCLNAKGFDTTVAEFNTKKEALRVTVRKYKSEILSLCDDYKKQENQLIKVKAAYEKQYNAVMKKNKEIANIATEITRLNKLKSNIESKIELKNALEKELSEIKIEDTSLTIKMINAKEKTLMELLENEKEMIKLTENKKMVELENQKREMKEIEVENLKLFEKVLKSEKLNLISESIKPLLDNINNFLAEINFKYSAFIKSDGKKATIGFIKDKKEIELDMLSTGESMMFIISIINAIYSKINSQFKILILDDIDNLDKENLKLLFNNKEILKRHFNNILLIGVLEDVSIPSDIKIIEMK